MVRNQPGTCSLPVLEGVRYGFALNLQCFVGVVRGPFFGPSDPIVLVIDLFGHVRLRFLLPAKRNGTGLGLIENARICGHLQSHRTEPGTEPPMQQQR